MALRPLRGQSIEAGLPQIETATSPAKANYHAEAHQPWLTSGWIWTTVAPASRAGHALTNLPDPARWFPARGCGLRQRTGRRASPPRQTRRRFFHALRANGYSRWSVRALSAPSSVWIFSYRMAQAEDGSGAGVPTAPLPRRISEETGSEQVRGSSALPSGGVAGSSRALDSRRWSLRGGWAEKRIGGRRIIHQLFRRGKTYAAVSFLVLVPLNGQSGSLSPIGGLWRRHCGRGRPPPGAVLAVAPRGF